MAESKKAAEETAARSSARPSGPSVSGVEDRVVMASRHPDGTPAQSAGFEFVGDRDAVLAGAEHQLQSVEFAKLQTTVEDAPTVEDNERAAEEGAKRARAEVDERHHG